MAYVAGEAGFVPVCVGHTQVEAVVNFMWASLANFVSLLALYGGGDVWKAWVEYKNQKIFTGKMFSGRHVSIDIISAHAQVTTDGGKQRGDWFMIALLPTINFMFPLVVIMQSNYLNTVMLYGKTG